MGYEGNYIDCGINYYLVYVLVMHKKSNIRHCSIHRNALRKSNNGCSMKKR